VTADEEFEMKVEMARQMGGDEELEGCTSERQGRPKKDWLVEAGKEVDVEDDVRQSGAIARSDKIGVVLFEEG